MERGRCVLRWGLVRQRYDFTTDVAKAEYHANHQYFYGSRVHGWPLPQHGRRPARRRSRSGRNPARNVPGVQKPAAVRGAAQSARLDSESAVGRSSKQFRHRRLRWRGHQSMFGHLLRQPVADHRGRRCISVVSEFDPHARYAHLQGGHHARARSISPARHVRESSPANSISGRMPPIRRIQAMPSRMRTLDMSPNMSSRSAGVPISEHRTPGRGSCRTHGNSIGN